MELNWFRGFAALFAVKLCFTVASGAFFAAVPPPPRYQNKPLAWAAAQPQIMGTAGRKSIAFPQIGGQSPKKGPMFCIQRELEDTLRRNLL